jgi:hypothetical protein
MTHGLRECPANLWREGFYEVYPADKLDTKLKAFIRAMGKLQELDLVKISGVNVLLPDKRNVRMSGCRQGIWCPTGNAIKISDAPSS